MSDDDETATLEIAADIHPIAAQEVTALEGEAIEVSKGATRRRMNSLRTIIRQVIFKQFGHKVNERHRRMPYQTLNQTNCMLAY
jgi:hypothetical protein